MVAEENDTLTHLKNRHNMRNRSEDKPRSKYLALCAYEFKDGKIQRLRTVFDRLVMAQQAAAGWFGRMAVNGIVKRMGKGP